MALPRVATVTFAAGAFDSDQSVTVATSHDEAIAAMFEVNSAIFSPGARTVWELRVQTAAPPANSTTLEVTVPSSTGDATSATVFVAAQEGSELELVQRFIPVPATRVDASRLSVELGPWAFFKGATAAGIEAVVIVTGPGGVSPSVGYKTSGLIGAGTRRDPLDACPDIVIPFAPPLDTLTMIRDFSDVVTIIDGQTKKGHPGIDWKAADSTPVKAVANGTVVRAVDSNGQPLTADNGGAGGTIVLAIPGGTVQYMHLKKGELRVAQGDTVRAGQVIALSDTSGFSTGPHLHFELRPTGWDVRIPPGLCVAAERAQVYEMVVDFSETKVSGATRYDEAARGTLQFELVYEAPAIPSQNLPAQRIYQLTTSSHFAMTNYFATRTPQDDDCSAFEPVPTAVSARGHLTVFPDTRTYRVDVDLEVTAQLNCTSVSGAAPYTASATCFNERGADLAVDCVALNNRPPDYPADYTEFSYTNGLTLTGASAMTCTESSVQRTINATWTIAKVQ